MLHLSESISLATSACFFSFFLFRKEEFNFGLYADKWTQIRRTHTCYNLAYTHVRGVMAPTSPCLVCVCHFYLTCYSPPLPPPSRHSSSRHSIPYDHNFTAADNTATFRQCKNDGDSDKYEEIKSSNNKGGLCRFENGAEPSEGSDYTKYSFCNAGCCLRKCNAEAACTGFELVNYNTCEIHTGDLQTVKPNNGAECFKRCEYFMTTKTTTTKTTATTSKTTTSKTSTTASTTTTYTTTSTTIVSSTTRTTTAEDCVETQDVCTVECEAASERNYRVVKAAVKDGKECLGASDCQPGDGMCPTTTSTATSITTTRTTTTNTDDEADDWYDDDTTTSATTTTVLDPVSDKTAATTIQVTTPPMQPTTTTNSNIEFAGNGTISLTTTSAASDDGGPLPPTTGATPKPTAFNSSDANAINQTADDGTPTSAGKSFGIAITVIIPLAGVAFVLHRKYSNSKSADDEARHVEAEFNERENSRNTMSMESNPLARTQSDVATHITSLPGETRNRADTHENWPMPAEAAAAEDSTVTTAVYVNQAFEPTSTRSNSNVVRLRAGGRQNQPAENPTPRRNSGGVSVYVEADPVYSKSQDGTVQLYENDFPRPPPAAATAVGKQQNYEDFSLIIGGIDMEAGGGRGGGQGGAAGARGGSDAGNGAHFYENHAPGYPSAVYAVPEVLTEYNSDYQIPDALTVEGVNLDYADLNNHQSLYDSSV